MLRFNWLYYFSDLNFCVYLLHPAGDFAAVTNVSEMRFLLHSFIYIFSMFQSFLITVVFFLSPFAATAIVTYITPDAGGTLTTAPCGSTYLTKGPASSTNLRLREVHFWVLFLELAKNTRDCQHEIDDVCTKPGLTLLSCSHR